MSKVVSLRGATVAEKHTRTKMDTIALTPEIVRNWKHANFQRALRVNDKVQEVKGSIQRDGGILPGILTLGIVGAETYLVDGQHRCEAFLLSDVKEGYADVRYHWFDSIADMAKEFEQLNSSLVAWKSDDILRAMEAYTPSLQKLRQLCPFIGYTMIRRGSGTSTVIGMAQVLRCWFAAEHEVPQGTGATRKCADRLTVEEATALAAFLTLAFEAWGSDQEFYRLWGSLTLTLSMWLYRRTVIGLYTPATTRLTREQYRRGLQALSANERHLEYLTGRTISDASRAPTYNRMKLIFAERLTKELGGKKPRLPSPSWAH